MDSSYSARPWEPSHLLIYRTLGAFDPPTQYWLTNTAQILSRLYSCFYLWDIYRLTFVDRHWTQLTAQDRLTESHPWSLTSNLFLISRNCRSCAALVLLVFTWTCRLFAALEVLAMLLVRGTHSLPSFWLIGDLWCCAYHRFPHFYIDSFSLNK